MRSDIHCPGCDVRGDAGGVIVFAERGHDEHGNAVVRCLNCGCGFVVASRGVLRKRVRGVLIEPDLWARMELIWERNNPIPATAAPATPDPRALAAGLIDAGLTGSHVVHQLAEATELSETDARALLGEMSLEPPPPAAA
jgi:hypothetical protein